MHPQGKKEILLENLFGVHPIPDPCFRRLEKEDLENEDPRKRRPPLVSEVSTFSISSTSEIRVLVVTPESSDQLT